MHCGDLLPIRQKDYVSFSFKINEIYLIWKIANVSLFILSMIVKIGAEGIILGCTEIPLLIKQEYVNIPVFNTTMIHALAAVDFMLE